MLEAAALRADCSRCAALCCVALELTRSADFAIDKPAGTPCPNLAPDLRCGIHARLRTAGFAGCSAYDCFGAGQRVTASFAGHDWRDSPDLAGRMFAALPIVRQLHELLFYLADALARAATVPLHAALEAAWARVESLADGVAVSDVDAADQRAQVNILLLRASELVRAEVPRRRDHRGADLIGVSRPGADLRAADLRGAYLIAADLHDADLSLADLIGADLRDTDLRGARLASSLFVTQMQLSAAHGNAATTIPPALTRPAHWT